MRTFYAIDFDLVLSTVTAHDVQGAKNEYERRHEILPNLILEAPTCKHGAPMPPDIPEWMEYSKARGVSFCRYCTGKKIEPTRKPKKVRKRRKFETPEDFTAFRKAYYREYSRLRHLKRLTDKQRTLLEQLQKGSIVTEYAKRYWVKHQDGTIERLHPATVDGLVYKKLIQFNGNIATTITKDVRTEVNTN